MFRQAVRRALALLLALCLLPAAALGEVASLAEEWPVDSSAVTRADFDLSVQLHADAFPADGLTDYRGWETFLSKLRLSGVIDLQRFPRPNNRMYMEAQLLLNDRELTQFSFEDYWGFRYVRSPALCNRSIHFQMNNYLEFMLKPYEYYELPTQYGLTIGEAARYIRDYQKLTLDLTVIPLEGWERGMYLDDTDLPWVAPSPTCATLNAALCYIGTCVFEGTNLSEGRGTTLPFEVIGAPFINGALLEKKMNGLGLPGVHFRRTSFCPTFSKHPGGLCHGVQMHVLDRETYDSFTDGLLLLDTIRSLYPEEFQFVRWSEKSPYSIDLLLGTDEYRTGALTAQGLMDKYAPKVKEFVEAAKQYRLY